MYTYTYTYIYDLSSSHLTTKDVRLRHRALRGADVYSTVQ